MLEQMGITRHIAWVAENRTRFNPGLGKWKPSFHIFADLWFPNNYEMMPVFVKEAMAKAKLPCHWIDFSVYQMKSLLRMIGVSSYHTLPRAEEDVFPMCITASMSEVPDVTPDHMKKLDMEWVPRVTDPEHVQPTRSSYLEVTNFATTERARRKHHKSHPSQQARQLLWR